MLLRLRPEAQAVPEWSEGMNTYTVVVFDLFDKKLAIRYPRAKNAEHACGQMHIDDVVMFVFEGEQRDLTPDGYEDARNMVIMP
jgi:hypothetical protein